jgi:translation initiation factor 1
VSCLLLIAHSASAKHKHHIAEYDAKKLLKAFKKVSCGFTVALSVHTKLPIQEFACNGTLVDDEEAGQVIQLQGDQRTKISNFLVEEGISRNTIKVHGF